MADGPIGSDIPDHAPLTLFSTDPSSTLSLRTFFDPATGEFRTFGYPPGNRFWDRVRRAHADGLTGRGETIVVVDSGVLSAHPVIARSLRSATSFVSGGDPQDRLGHGTAVALLALLAAPDATLVSLKVVDDGGSGDVGALVRALEAIAAEPEPVQVNLSVGVYSKRWLVLDCRGDCRVCAAAVGAARAGHRLVIAAGNRAGATSCPGTAAKYHPELPMFAVEAVDPVSGERAPYSGEGNTGAPVSAMPLVTI